MTPLIKEMAAPDAPADSLRALPVRAVLTALLCLALDDRPLHLTEATRVLFDRISDASRALLGVTGAITGRRGFLAAYRRVRYCFHALLSVADPSALPKNRRLTPEQLTAASRKMTPAQATAARDRLETLINSLVEASVSVLDDAERTACDGSAGLDATAVPLFSRGPSKRAGLAASDPDGGWYAREVGHRWHRSSCVAFSWLCSLFLVGFLFLFWRCPAGAGVEAGRACPALA